jgi:transposase
MQKLANSQEARAPLTARRLPLDKLRDVELSLRGFGRRLGKVTQRGCETRVRELVANHPMLQQITGSMLLGRATPQREHDVRHKALLKIVRREEVCRQFMTRGRPDCSDHVRDGD